MQSGAVDAGLRSSLILQGGAGEYQYSIYSCMRGSLRLGCGGLHQVRVKTKKTVALSDICHLLNCYYPTFT